MPLPLIPDTLNSDSIDDLITNLNQTKDQEIQDASMSDGHTLRLTTQDSTNLDVTIPRSPEGISSGCWFTFTGSLAADVDAGVAQGGGKVVTVVAASIGFTARDATNDRIDYVVADDTSGVVSVIAGTPSAAPVAPSIPSGKIPLHLVWIDRASVPANDYVVMSHVLEPSSVGMTFSSGIVSCGAYVARKSGTIDPANPSLSYQIVLVPTSMASATVTFLLEDPAGKPDMEWIIQDDGNASGFNIVLDAAANGGTINGANDYTISTDYQQVRLLRIMEAYYVG